MFNEGLASNQSLVELDLSFNSLGDQGLIELQDGLIDAYTLKKLNLSHNNIGEDSSKAMSAILKETQSLRELDLSWNDFYTQQGQFYLSYLIFVAVIPFNLFI